MRGFPVPVPGDRGFPDPRKCRRGRGFGHPRLPNPCNERQSNWTEKNHLSLSEIQIIPESYNINLIIRSISVKTFLADFITLQAKHIS